MAVTESVAGLMQDASDFDLQSRSTGMLPGIPVSAGRHLRFSEEDQPEPIGGASMAVPPQHCEEPPESESQILQLSCRSKNNIPTTTQSHVHLDGTVLITEML